MGAISPPHPGRAEPAAGPRKPGVAATLLLPQDRIAREPLTPWAARLQRELAGCRAVRTTRERAIGVSGIANNTALIAAHLGDAGRAGELCRAHLRWQVRLARRSGDGAVAGHAVQPWINLARLEALSGEWEAALARFTVLRRSRPGRPIDLGGVRVPAEGWRVLGESEEDAARFMEGVCLVETLKALLANRRHAEILALAAEREPPRRPALARMMAEAAIVAAAGNGELERARRMAAAARHDSTGWERMVFQLRLAEVLGCAGAADDAAGFLRPIVRAGAALSRSTAAELQPLHVLARTAGAAAEAGLQEEAATLARTVLDGARTARDELFELQALRILAGSAPPAERGGWREELARLEESTEYRRERRGAVAPPGPPVTELYAALSGVLDD